MEIKDLIEGAKAADAIALQCRVEGRPPGAVLGVPKHKLVEAVREVLARHFT